MRTLFSIFTLTLGLQLGLPLIAQRSDAKIDGASNGCFAGKRYHPAKVEIYLFNVSAVPEIPKLIHQMEGYAARSDSTNQDKFFDLYNRLLHSVKVSTSLGRARSDQSGFFRFRGLPSGLSVIVVGISPMEDEPAFYAYRELSELRAGKNIVTLDFSRGDTCN